MRAECPSVRSPGILQLISTPPRPSLPPRPLPGDLDLPPLACSFASLHIPRGQGSPKRKERRKRSGCLLFYFTFCLLPFRCPSQSIFLSTSNILGMAAAAAPLLKKCLPPLRIAVQECRRKREEGCSTPIALLSFFFSSFPSSSLETIGSLRQK